MGKAYDGVAAQSVPGQAPGTVGMEMTYPYSRISPVLNTLDIAKPRFGFQYNNSSTSQTTAPAYPFNTITRTHTLSLHKYLWQLPLKKVLKTLL